VLHVLWVLAWGLIRTLFGRMLGARPGLPLFRASYDEDRLPPCTPEERALLPQMSRCIACGLCDIGGPKPRGAGPMDLALASSRQTPDADAATRSIASIPDDVLTERERICPTGVPLLAIARLTRARAAAIARS
jgi:succinate dehydrogenase/fumarate reductase-like Fe-S protein